MTPAQEAAIRRHGENLHAIFPQSRSTDAVALCKKLRRIETKANRLAVDLCNGDVDQEAYEIQQGKIREGLDKILGFVKAGVPVFLNGDPRGYALKIREWAAKPMQIHRDMGGYGIIAPEIDKHGH